MLDRAAGRQAPGGDAYRSAVAEVIAGRLTPPEMIDSLMSRSAKPERFLLRQSLFQVGPKVLDVFDSDRHSDQAFRHGEQLTSPAAAAFEVDSTPPRLVAWTHKFSRSMKALASRIVEFDGQRAEAGHRTAGHLVAGIVRQAEGSGSGIPMDVAEALGENCGVLLRSLQAQGQGAQAAENRWDSITPGTAPALGEWTPAGRTDHSGPICTTRRSSASEWPDMSFVAGAAPDGLSGSAAAGATASRRCYRPRQRRIGHSSGQGLEVGDLDRRIGGGLDPRRSASSAAEMHSGSVGDQHPAPVQLSAARWSIRAETPR